MISPALRHILDLTAKTGDRCVVFDAQTEESFVLMPVAHYEQLLDKMGKTSVIASSSPVEQANEDIALWREQQRGQEVGQDKNLTELSEKDTTETVAEDERFYIEPVE